MRMPSGTALLDAGSVPTMIVETPYRSDEVSRLNARSR